MTGDMISAPIAAPKETGIQTIEVRRLEGEYAVGRKPAADTADDFRRIINMFDDMKHRCQIDAAIWNFRCIFHALAEYSAVAFLPEQIYHISIQFETIERRTRDARLLEYF